MDKHYIICFNLYKPLKAFGHLFKFKIYHYEIRGSNKKGCWHMLEAIPL